LLAKNEKALKCTIAAAEGIASPCLPFVGRTVPMPVDVGPRFL
jgi:hypothetical protein